ncbi:MAG TPA: hypothetical protein VE954_02565 [Oligoflexus sp.]|uniref:hypothetical protein n=1 Tax=Oligoflexus sp. TaxID=1971216 RepID=UPI002D75D2B0|nr:hypothetical protein [Oligoflexus sp.]HYX31970.1 hypothetical protein [Oligoflexus sp.]
MQHKKLVLWIGLIVLEWSCAEPTSIRKRSATPQQAATQTSQGDAVPSATESKDGNKQDTTPAPASTPAVAELPAVTLVKPFPGDTYGCKDPYQKPWTCENFTVNGVAQGSFLTIQRPEARYLLAAPHGWFDTGTDVITHSIFPASIPAGYPIWSQMIAHSFRGNAPSGLQHNVNRPSTLTNDVCTNPAALATSKSVYDGYKAQMDRLASKPALYFEIHGQSELGLEASLEVATERISAAEAEKVRKILSEELARAGIAGITIVIEPVDTVFFNAGQTKQCGSINHVTPGPAIHTEVPRIMREGDEPQLKTAKFYRAALNRLATEVFPVTRTPIPTVTGAMLVDFAVEPEARPWQR